MFALVLGFSCHTLELITVIILFYLAWLQLRPFHTRAARAPCFYGNFWLAHCVICVCFDWSDVITTCFGFTAVTNEKNANSKLACKKDGKIGRDIVLKDELQSAVRMSSLLIISIKKKTFERTTTIQHSSYLQRTEPALFTSCVVHQHTTVRVTCSDLHVEFSLPRVVHELMQVEKVLGKTAVSVGQGTSSCGEK